MDLTGKIKEIHIDYIKRKPILSLILNQEPNGIESLMDQELQIKIGKHRERRSLDSNAYFHVLCDKLRQAIGISMNACKNELITSYGQMEYIEEGHPLIYKTNAPPEYIKEQATPHMELIKIGEDGAYWYRIYRGSHTYNTAEMAKLIEGTIQECKEWDIETATPDELAKMQAAWERNRHE